MSIDTEQDQARVRSIVKDLDLESEESIVLINTRAGNKPSASSGRTPMKTDRSTR
ncbi:MAG: hypothetical protein M3473_02785 [Chloroflexota bacterium]|nr:hypothetical protein [Chloroflexota bacterium]